MAVKHLNVVSLSISGVFDVRVNYISFRIVGLIDEKPYSESAVKVCIWTTHSAGRTPTKRSTLKAMRLCRFQCSTATATISPPTNNRFVSFRYCIHTWDSRVTQSEMCVNRNSSLLSQLYTLLHLVYLRLWIAWCQTGGKGVLGAELLQPVVGPLYTSKPPSALSHRHILPPEEKHVKTYWQMHTNTKTLL